jgi:hypothetical protein
VRQSTLIGFRFPANPTAVRGLSAKGATTRHRWSRVKTAPSPEEFPTAALDDKRARFLSVGTIAMREEQKLALRWEAQEVGH